MLLNHIFCFFDTAETTEFSELAELLEVFCTELSFIELLLNEIVQDADVGITIAAAATVTITLF